MASYRYPNLEFGILQKPTVNPEPAQAVRYVRSNFIGAGVDNFAQPPSQDPEMMEVLTNVSPIVDGSIRRRGGYSLWANPGTPAIDHAIDYQNDVTLQRQIVLSSTTNVRAQNDDGSNYNTNIFTPVTSVAAGPRGCNSRGYMFFSDGQKPDYQKWSGTATGGNTKWGIDINQVSGVVAGPNAPSTVADLGSAGQHASQGPLAPNTFTNIALFSAEVPWTIQSGGGQVSVLSGESSEYLTASNFGFTLPSTATVLGIQASVNWSNPRGSLVDTSVLLAKNGVITVGRDNGQPDEAQVTSVYGNSTDLWGTTWTYTDINATNFGVGWSLTNNSGLPFGTIITVNSVSITVYYSVPGGGNSWTNPNNIKVQDGAVASATAITSGTSALQASNFSLAPSGDIIGIQVDILCKVSGTPFPTLSMVLNKAGAAFGATKSAPVMSAGLTNITFGGPTDLWNGTWANSDINGSSTFGCQFNASTLVGTTTISVDVVTITVYGSAPAITLGSPTSGAITLISGRRYYAVFENSTSVHYSDLNPISASTGALSAQQQPLSTIPVSLDPQVDRVDILATADGGNPERLYLVANLANGTTTYTDNTPELTLLAQPVLLSTDTNGVEFGVADNAPPPVGALYPTKHRGRMYMTAGPTLYWSKSISDITTDIGFIAGRWEEAWPAFNQTDISEGAETPRGLLSDGVNLYIGTEYKIRRLNGDAPFLEPPDIIHNEVGILNQDVWKICFAQGTPMGAIWLTPDQRIVGSDFNTYTDLGTPIQSTLNNINQAVANKVARAAFYSNGPLDLYILAIPTLGNTANDTLCVYNLRSQKWFIWQLTDTLTEMLFNITITGSSQLLFAAATGVVYSFNPTPGADRVGNTPVTPVVTVRTSWLDMQDPAMRKMLNEIEVQTSDAGLLVTVEGASTEVEFSGPNVITSAQQVALSPRGEFKAYLAGKPSKDRYYRFTFVSNANVPLVLGGLNIEHVPVNRQ